jgi:hypothetical protein
MWETKSTNSITVNGGGQTPRHSVASAGRIIGFETSDWVDYVAGDAGGAYGDALRRFERHVVFVKPELLVIYDVLEAPKASTFEWRLHSPVENKVAGLENIGVTSGDVRARVAMLWPKGLEVSVTDKYDVPPRERIKVKEWHLTAKSEAAEKVEFVTVMRVGRGGTRVDQRVALEVIDGKKTVQVTVGDETVNVSIVTDGQSSPLISVQRRGAAGKALSKAFVPTAR